jgi:hypothetical protein
MMNYFLFEFTYIFSIENIYIWVQLSIKHLQEWLFHSHSGVGVGETNYSGVGTGVEANNFSRVDSGVDFLLSVFFCHSFLHTHRVSPNKGTINNQHLTGQRGGVSVPQCKVDKVRGEVETGVPRNMHCFRSHRRANFDIFGESSPTKSVVIA